MNVKCTYCSLPVCLQKSQFQYVSAVWKQHKCAHPKQHSLSGKMLPHRALSRPQACLLCHALFQLLDCPVWSPQSFLIVLYTQKVLNNRHKAFCAHTPPNQTCLQARDPHKSREVVKALLWVCLLAHQGYHVQTLCTHLALPSKQCSHIWPLLFCHTCSLFSVCASLGPYRPQLSTRTQFQQNIFPCGNLMWKPS